MMPMHLFILTIVKNVFKSEMTYEKLEQKQQVEQFYNDSRDKAFYYMHMM
ncbi:YrzI family small protein [Pseudalkalibacillus decolorationis]|nr:YrzI family small protein [Pseudalkalibacillus decolorationis]